MRHLLHPVGSLTSSTIKNQYSPPYFLPADNPSYFSVSADSPKRATKSDPKKSLRAFLRSVSSNSADSNQELLIMGEPRLSDIAPDIAFKHQANRSNSLKSREHQEFLYNPLPTSEEGAESGDEVSVKRCLLKRKKRQE